MERQVLVISRPVASFATTLGRTRNKLAQHSFFHRCWLARALICCAVDMPDRIVIVPMIKGKPRAMTVNGGGVGEEVTARCPSLQTQTLRISVVRLVGLLPLHKKSRPATSWSLTCVSSMSHTWSFHLNSRSAGISFMVGLRHRSRELDRTPLGAFRQRSELNLM